ncbi:Wzz/FepE/Etk N-terminal domain-containing protein, partial [Pelodictyon luteolum]|uniref:Wzz/FepE/Etk N-terminal domain-containing protein n=1 Tax=Pelodictyon luteolum TaxID=1100 RepID=UPI0026EBF458
MSEQMQPTLHPVERSRPYDEDEISLLDLAITLAKHKKAILLAPLIAGALTAVATLFMPNIYTADTTIMPPQQQSSTAAMLASQLGAMAGGGGAALGLKNPNELYVAMLKSRNVQDGIIQRFKLHEVYETDTPAETRKALKEATKITTGKDGLI